MSAKNIMRDVIISHGKTRQCICIEALKQKAVDQQDNPALPEKITQFCLKCNVLTLTNVRSHSARQICYKSLALSNRCR